MPLSAFRTVVCMSFVTATLGGGAVTLGALDGAADLTAAVIKWVSGRLSDRPGWRKPPASLKADDAPESSISIDLVGIVRCTSTPWEGCP